MRLFGIGKFKLFSRVICAGLAYTLLFSPVLSANDLGKSGVIDCKTATLSPALHLNMPLLQALMLKQLSLKPEPAVEIYRKEAYKADIRIFARPEGYRVEIKADHENPLTLHWGINSWEKPPEAILPDRNHFRNYFDDKTNSTRTEVLSAAEAGNTFVIDIPKMLIDSIETLKFVFFDNYTPIQNNAFKNYEIPIKNALDVSIDQWKMSSGPESEGDRSRLEQLLKHRLTPPIGPGDHDLDTSVLYSKVSPNGNVISEVKRKEGGFEIRFWAVSDDKPRLYWGINGWQLPSLARNIMPKNGIWEIEGDKKNVYVDMELASEEGLYMTSMFISDEFWPRITQIDFNIHYPDNGRQDDNGGNNYDIQLGGMGMISSLVRRLNNIYIPEAQHQETALLLKNALSAFSKEISFEELLKLFKEIKSVSFEDNDALGFILIAKLINEGAVWDEAREKMVVDKDKVSTAVAEIIERLDPLCVNKCLWLFGMLETSWISRLVHGLDYKQLYEGQEDNSITDMNQFIQNKINAYKDDDKPQVLEAKAVSKDRLFLKMNFNGNIISTFIGYTTKENKYYYEGKKIVLRDTLGNEFSRMNLRLGAHVDREKIKALIEEGHKKGIKFMVNFFDWHSPEVLDKDNYMYYHHRFLNEGEDDLTVLSGLGNYAAILSLPEGRKVLVEHRPGSADQLKPNLTPDSDSGAYWKERFFEHVKYFIDEFNVDAFRVDLPGELQENDSREVFQSACFEAVKYAAEQNKQIFFCLETYEQGFFGDECALFNKWNEHAAITKYNYEPFRPYHDMVNKSLLTGDSGKLKTAYERVARRVEKLVLFLTNFDEELLKDMIPDKKVREKHVLILHNFVRAGYDGLMYLRDFDIGDVASMAGGKRTLWGGVGRYFTHKPATKKQFRDRMEKSTGELVDDAEAYQLLKSAPVHSFSRVFFSGNKIVFYRPGYSPEVFDLDKMVSPMPPIELLDMEHDVNLWLAEHVRAVPDVAKNYGKAIKVIDSAVASGSGDNSQSSNALYNMVCQQGNENFARWDWTKHKTAALVMRHDQVLTVDNGHPFVVTVRKKGQEEFERVESLEVEENKKYMCMLFGLEPGKYEINFLWTRKHENNGWEEGGWFDVEVLSEEQGEKLKSYSLSNLPKPSFLVPELRTVPRAQISSVKYRRKDRNFILQLPVFACRQKNGEDKGGGKFTDLADTCKMYNNAMGAHEFLLLPIHPTLDDEYSPYAPASKRALNERFIDWDSVIDEYFPHLRDRKPPYLKEKGHINYDEWEKRDSILAFMVMDELQKLEGSSELLQHVNAFAEKADWLHDYARFRTLTQMFQKPWWEWSADEKRIHQAEQEDVYKETVRFYKFAQFFARKQWNKAEEEIHTYGLKLVDDRPYFSAVNSAEVWLSWRDNKNYFLDRNRHPGVQGKKLQIFDTLSLYNYTVLAEQPRPYDFFLSDIEYKVEELKFDGNRYDALHLAYDWNAEWLRSGNEPGDVLVDAMTSLYSDKIFIAEQLGATGKVMQHIRDKEITTMEHLEWLWPKDNVPFNIMLSLTSHDEARVSERYGGRTEDVYSKSFKQVFDYDVRYVSTTVGDDFLDNHRINNPYIKEKKYRRRVNWRLRLPHPLDPDYNQRVKEDLTPYIRSLSAEYLGDWDAMYYEGMDKGREVFINGLSDQTRRDIENKINFKLLYNFGDNELKNIEEVKIKALFKEIYKELATAEKGEDSLSHHGHHGDFFSVSKNILEKFLGLTRDGNPEVWEYIDSLEEQMLKDNRRYKRDAANIRLLGFMSGIFEKIEESARNSTLDTAPLLHRLTPDAETNLAELAGQSV
ncbi:MAG: 4-alpha-glucanotransferase [Candidatus Omnitrophica bacterium]|nr:4-alpha-glucanotransferase [Candidatus Omnitrophota bacterium]